MLKSMVRHLKKWGKIVKNMLWRLFKLETMAIKKLLINGCRLAKKIAFSAIFWYNIFSNTAVDNTFIDVMKNAN